jgi:hypothetical protein
LPCIITATLLGGSAVERHTGSPIYFGLKRNVNNSIIVFAVETWIRKLTGKISGSRAKRNPP